MRRGAEFSELQPRDAQSNLLLNDFVTLPSSAEGLENGTIFQFTSLDRFRMGQQVLFWLGVSSSVFNDGNSWISKLRLKPWWLRPNIEFRTPGDPQYLGVDRAVFKGTGIANNRYVWMPSPKRLDVTPFDTAPPSIPPTRHSDSLMLDDLWTVELQAADNTAYTDLFASDQEASRWIVFMYPAMGYALGFTWEAEVGGEEATIEEARVSLTWAAGTLGGTNYQENIG